MLLDIIPIFKNEGCIVPFEFKANFAKLEVNHGEFPFKNPVKVFGAAKNDAGTVEVSGAAEVICNAKCDRCLTDIEFTENAPFLHCINDETGSNDDDEIIVKDKKIDLYHIAEMALIIEYPHKHLCKDDCKGICLNCGANLNETTCGCVKKEIDPRLAKLKELID